MNKRAPLAHKHTSTQGLFLRSWQCFVILIAFLFNAFGPLPIARADEFRLPEPGVMVRLSPPLDPPMLKGIKVHSNNPFRFDFILDKGDSELSKDQLKQDSSKLIKYFLASLTIPEKDLWVNLSPYEKDRIIPNSFGLTEMGRDLLAEDYMLKQITASLIYPEDAIGKKFWKRIYEKAQKKFGTTNVPVNTFNKVWIVPEKAVVYENANAGTAYVVESKLKVMLEQDYLSLSKHKGIQSEQVQKDTSQLGSQVVREIVIPELTKEVNENKNFAQLRQVYNSLILATWYKQMIKDSILEQVYADKNKVAGVNITDPQEKEKIYQRYLKAFKKGVYNYIKEDIDPITQQTIPRKYFSGGMNMDLAMNTTLQTVLNPKILPSTNPSSELIIEMRVDAAMGEGQTKSRDQALISSIKLQLPEGIAYPVDYQGPKEYEIWFPQEVMKALERLPNDTEVILFGRVGLYTLMGQDGPAGKRPLKELSTDFDIMVRHGNEEAIKEAFQAQNIPANITMVSSGPVLSSETFNTGKLFLNVKKDSQGALKFAFETFEKDSWRLFGHEFRYDPTEIPLAMNEIKQRQLRFKSDHPMTSEEALRGLGYVIRDGFIPDRKTKVKIINGLELSWGDKDLGFFEKIFTMDSWSGVDCLEALANDYYQGSFKERVQGVLRNYLDRSYYDESIRRLVLKLLFSRRSILLYNNQVKLDFFKMLISPDHKHLLLSLLSDIRGNETYLANFIFLLRSLEDSKPLLTMSNPTPAMVTLEQQFNSDRAMKTNGLSLLSTDTQMQDAILNVLPEEERMLIDLTLKFSERIRALQDQQKSSMEIARDLESMDGRFSVSKWNDLIEQLTPNIERGVLYFLTKEHPYFLDIKPSETLMVRIENERLKRKDQLYSFDLEKDHSEKNIEDIARQLIENVRLDPDIEGMTKDIDRIILNTASKNPEVANAARAILNQFIQSIFKSEGLGGFAASEMFLFNKAIVFKLLDEEFARKHNVVVVYCLSGATQFYEQVQQIAEIANRSGYKIDLSRLKGLYLNRKIMQGPDDLVKDYLRQNGVTEDKTVYIIDTGYKGTIGMEVKRFIPHVKTRLFMRSNPLLEKGNTPEDDDVIGWNDVRYPKDGKFIRFSEMLNDRLTILVRLFDVCFPKLLKSPTRLQRNRDGIVQPVFSTEPLSKTAKFIQQLLNKETARMLEENLTFDEQHSGSFIKESSGKISLNRWVGVGDRAMNTEIDLSLSPKPQSVQESLLRVGPMKPLGYLGLDSMGPALAEPMRAYVRERGLSLIEHVGEAPRFQTHEIDFKLLRELLNKNIRLSHFIRVRLENKGKPLVTATNEDIAIEIDQDIFLPDLYKQVDREKLGDSLVKKIEKWEQDYNPRNAIRYVRLNIDLLRASYPGVFSTNRKEYRTFFIYDENALQQLLDRNLDILAPGIPREANAYVDFIIKNVIPDEGIYKKSYDLLAIAFADERYKDDPRFKDMLLAGEKIITQRQQSTKAPRYSLAMKAMELKKRVGDQAMRSETAQSSKAMLTPPRDLKDINEWKRWEDGVLGGDVNWDMLNNNAINEALDKTKPNLDLIRRFNAHGMDKGGITALAKLFIEGIDKNRPFYTGSVLTSEGKSYGGITAILECSFLLLSDVDGVIGNDIKNVKYVVVNEAIYDRGGRGFNYQGDELFNLLQNTFKNVKFIKAIDKKTGKTWVQTLEEIAAPYNRVQFQLKTLFNNNKQDVVVRNGAIEKRYRFELDQVRGLRVSGQYSNGSFGPLYKFERYGNYPIGGTSDPIRFTVCYNRKVGVIVRAEKPIQVQVDTAMKTHVVENKSGPGGIDLTPANMNLQTQNSGEGIKFYVDSAMLAQLKNALGFVPVIINIQPLKSLPEFLGISEALQSGEKLALH